MGVALQLARAVQGGAAAAGRTAAAPPSVSSSMLRLDPDTVIAGRVRVDLSSFPYPPKIPPSLSSSFPSSSIYFSIFILALFLFCLFFASLGLKNQEMLGLLRLWAVIWLQFESRVDIYRISPGC